MAPPSQGLTLLPSPTSPLDMGAARGQSWSMCTVPASSVGNKVIKICEALGPRYVHCSLQPGGLHNACTYTRPRNVYTYTQDRGNLCSLEAVVGLYVDWEP